MNMHVMWIGKAEASFR